MDGDLGVTEAARRLGVSARALRYYDEVGLVRPARRDNDYRRYTTADLARLQRVIALREMGLSLADVAAFLDAEPDDDVTALLSQLRRQHERLVARRTALDISITDLERTMEAYAMDIRLTPEELTEVFGAADPTAHAAEAQQRWGETDAYAASRRRAAGYGKADWQAMKTELDAIHDRLAGLLRSGEPPTADAARAAAEAARQHICRWFYDCPPQLHLELGEMYVADERFAATYDAVEPGLAAYLREAIRANAGAG